MGNAVLERGRACENPVRFVMYDGPIETVEYIWVNTWCMIWSISPASLHG